MLTAWGRSDRTSRSTRGIRARRDKLFETRNQSGCSSTWCSAWFMLAVNMRGTATKEKKCCGCKRTSALTTHRLSAGQRVSLSKDLMPPQPAVLDKIQDRTLNPGTAACPCLDGQSAWNKGDTALNIQHGSQRIKERRKGRNDLSSNLIIHRPTDDLPHGTCLLSWCMPCHRTAGTSG
jgi:hypothetical protein